MTTENSLRGETAITFGPHEIPLKFNMSTIRKFEQTTGKGVAGAFHNELNFQFNDIAILIVIGAKEATKHSKVNLSRLDGYMDKYPSDYQEAAKRTMVSFQEAMPKPAKDDDDDNPTPDKASGGDAVPL